MRAFEILQTDADLCGALSDHADVRDGSENLVDTTRTLVGAFAVVVDLQPGNGWQRVSGELKVAHGSAATRSTTNPSGRTKSCSSFVNVPSSAGSHASWLLRI
jgi:hypothetical protein